MNNMLEYVVIGTYLLMLVIIGLIFRKFNNNVNDYFRGGCRGTWWLVGASTFIAGISAYTFTGAAGAVYDAGWSILIIYFGNTLGFLINYFYFAARFRQLRKTTGQEVVRDRFSKLTEQIYSWLSFPGGILGSAMLLYSLAIFISTIFGFNVQLLIIIVGSVVICYSIVGGRWAIMATDFVQCLIVMGLTLLVAGLCLTKLGGFSGLFDLIESKGLSSDFALINSPDRFKGSFTYFWAGAMLLNISLSANNLAAASRYFSVKDGKEAKKAALLAAILMLGGCIIWFLPPMTARIFYSETVMQMTQLSNPKESAFAVTCMKLLPPGMIGLMAVAMFAASISSLDTGLNGCSSVFIMNIYPLIAKGLKLKKLPPSAMLKLSRVFTLLFGILCISAALLFSLKQKLSLFELMLTVIALLGTPMTVPLVWGMIIRKCPRWAAISSICCGFLASITVFFSQELFGSPMGFPWKITIVYMAGTVGFLGTMFWVKNNSAEYNKQVEDFFKLMNTPVDFEKEVGQPNDRKQLKLLGTVAMVMGLLVSLLAIPAQDSFGVICPLLITLFMLMCGGGMYYAGSTKTKIKQQVTEQSLVSQELELAND